MELVIQGTGPCPETQLQGPASEALLKTRTLYKEQQYVGTWCLWRDRRSDGEVVSPLGSERDREMIASASASVKVRSGALMGRGGRAIIPSLRAV